MAWCHVKPKQDSFMKSISLRPLATALALAGLLVACGGGGGSDSGDQTSAVNLTQGPQTYRLASQFGTTVALTMDTGAGTFTYAAGNTTMSGTLRASPNGTYVLSTGISAANLQAELQVKDGAVGGALQLTNPLTGSLATAIVAGANEKLILKDTSKIATRYVFQGINATACNADRTFCGDFVSPPDTATRVSATELSMANCTVPTGATAQTTLSLDTAACPAVNGAPGLRPARRWTMDADGNFSSNAIVAPSTYKAFFAEFGGKAVGFSSLFRPSSATTTAAASVGVLFPLNQPTQAAELNGQWNFVSKDDRLTLQVNSLSDMSIYETGQPASSGEALGAFTLNQWGNGINSVLTIDSPPAAVPVVLAGPWVSVHIAENYTNYLGLKR
jgi:hypothetical protein